MDISTNRTIQLANLIDRLQTDRIRWYNASRKCAELGNYNGMRFFLAKAVKATSIIGNAQKRFGQAALMALPL